MNRMRFRLVMGITTVLLLLFQSCKDSGPATYGTDYFSITVDTKGFITSMKNITVNPAREFSPSDNPSPLLSLYDSKKDIYYEPNEASFSKDKKLITLKFTNGSTARIEILPQKKYFKLTLRSLSSRKDIDDIQWGSYQTNITNLLGEIIGVARDTSENVNYAIGVFALDDVTTGGDSRTDGDAPQLKYMIHSPDVYRFPIPDSLYEGESFSLGGSGYSDKAYFSMKAEYVRMMMGHSGTVDSLGRINITYHSMDRSRPKEILFSLIPFMEANKPNHQVTQALPGVDYIGSTIALWGSPDSTALMDVIQDIVIAEDLPYPILNGKWVKDPSRYMPDIVIHGQIYDSAVSYAHRLGFKSVYADDMPFFKPDRANKGYIDGRNFEKKPFRFSSGNKSHKEFSETANPLGILIGRHTITTALAPGTKDASPVPSDSVCWQQCRILTKDLTPADTLIEIDNPRYLEEIASWERHSESLNIIKIGKELIHYMGVTATSPYTLLNVTRGYWKTNASEHKKGDPVYKLQGTLNFGGFNAYEGLIPDIYLQDEIARYYADVCAINGIYFLDQDGQEFLYDQGHGNYSVKRFFRAFTERCKYHNIQYIRFTGAGLSEGSWHYQSMWNVGGGTNMYDLKTREWGSSSSEGKDIRNSAFANYFPATFGLNFNIGPESTVEQFEHIQAISTGVGVTYTLRINQKDVEKCPSKDAIFRTIRTWEDARAANAFPRHIRKQLSDPSKDWTLEAINHNSWMLYRRINSEKTNPVVLKRADGY